MKQEKPPQVIWPEHSIAQQITEAGVTAAAIVCFCSSLAQQYAQFPPRYFFFLILLDLAVD